MVNGIVVAILMVTIFGAIRYIVKEKAKGKKCIGCPSSGCCSKSCHCNDGART